MTSRRSHVRTYGFAAASVLLLGAACGQPQPSGTRPGGDAAPAQPQTTRQAAVSVRICAFRPNFSAIPTYCSASDDPAVLYGKVLDLIRANCIVLAQDPQNPTEAEKQRAWENCMSSPPVMWAESTSLDGLATWKAQVDRIAVFYRTSPSPDVTSRSYELSLQKIGEVARQMREAHGAELEQLRASNKYVLDTGLSDILKNKATEEGNAVQAELADHRESLGEIQEALDRHKARLETYQTAYGALVEQFAAYRANEPVLFNRLKELALQASTATLETLPAVQMELVQLSRAESRSPQELQLEAHRLAHQLAYEHDVLEQELGPYTDFIRNNNIPRPRLADESIQVLEGIVSYADSRYARMSDIVKKTLAGIRRRQDALAAQRADAATRQTILETSALDASTQFLAETNARVTEVGKLPPRSTKLRLYYLAGKLQEHEGILQLEPVCANAASTPWMGTGCNTLSLQFSKSRNYVTTTIPGTIRLNVAAMRTAGVSETLLQETEQHLTAGRLRAAAMAHDVALRSSEGP